MSHVSMCITLSKMYVYLDVFDSDLNYIVLKMQGHCPNYLAQD